MRTRGPAPVRLAFTRAVQDWYYGLIPFSILNLLWLLAVVTVVAGPPATAAMMAVARDAAVGEGAEPKNFFVYIRRFFWRAWGLGLLTAVGTVVFVTDLRLYSDLLRGTPVLWNIGVFFLLYVLVVWFEFLLVAWPLLVNQPEMSMRNLVRNSLVFTLRTPWANLGLALIAFLLFVLCFVLTIGISLVVAALLSLLAQHYLNIQAPVLANVPPTVGKGPVVHPDTEEE